MSTPNPVPANIPDQGFPNAKAPVLQGDIKALTRVWYNLILSLWQRTGQFNSAAQVQTGVAVLDLGPTVQTGYLLANGQAVSRSTYKTLFNRIGTVYGIGDGTTTFNLPILAVDGAPNGALAFWSIKT